mmetsp:Transcript_25650/g.46748  ORF Transcript_25650/g.46748 Transcript_25650/m.46748 type:complete len:525 (+) Transcript_25650:187-1761(+)
MALVSAAAAATAAAAAQYRRKASERRDGSGQEAEAEDEDDEDGDEGEEAEDNGDEEEEGEEDDAMTVVRHLDNEDEEEDEEGDEERDVDGGGEDDDGGDGDGDDDDEGDEEESDEGEGDEDDEHGRPRKKLKVLHPRLRGKGKTTESKALTTPSSSAALAMAGAHHKGASPNDGRMKRRGVQMGASESETKSPGLTTNRSRKRLAAAAAAAAIAAADTPRLRRSTVFRSEESQKVREKLQQQQKKRSWNAPSASWRPLSQEELLIEAARTEVENAISLQHLLALEEETKRQASIGKKLYDGPKIRIRSFRVGGGTGGGGGEKVGGTNGEEVEELTTLEVVNMPYLPDWLVPKESRLTAAAIASSNGNLLDPKRPNPSGAFLTNSVSKGPENTAVPPEIVRRRQLRGAPLVKAGQANSTTSLKTEEVPEPEKKVKPGWSPLGLPETRSVVSVKNPSDSGSECGFQGSLQQEPMSYGMMALVVNLYESLKGSLPPQRPTCAGDLLTSHSVNNAPCFHRASSQAKLD